MTKWITAQNWLFTNRLSYDTSCILLKDGCVIKDISNCVKWLHHILNPKSGFFFIPNTNTFASAGTISIKSMILKNQTRWSGYIVRMTDERTPEQLFYGELTERKRNWRKREEKFKDSIKSFGMHPKTIETLASDRDCGKQKCEIKAFEESRETSAWLKRDFKKNDTIEKVNPSDLFLCTVCDKPCFSFAGLSSHLIAYEKMKLHQLFFLCICAYLLMSCMAFYRQF